MKDRHLKPVPRTIKPHKWEPSRLGHGETMCAYCFGTNREIAVIGNPDVCDSPNAPVFEIKELSKD